jgi:hypothetical protein
MSGFAIVFVIAIVEMILSWQFVPLYFRAGIPVFQRKIECPHVGQPPATAEEIEYRLPESRWPSFSVQDIGAGQFGFREQAFSGSMRYTPVMHGQLIFDSTRNCVIVNGRLNWYLVVLVGVAIPHFKTDFDFSFAIVFLVIIGVIYWTQASRYSSVATTAADIWNSEAKPRGGELFGRG